MDSRRGGARGLGGLVSLGQYPGRNFPRADVQVQREQEVVHDLTRLELLWPLLQKVPQDERRGAIVKAYGEPIRERSYRKWYREIADAAGIPKSVWNMDSRAGAVTEALEAGAPMDEVRRTATHSSAVMTTRYDRAAETAPASVAEARKRARKTP